MSELGEECSIRREGGLSLSTEFKRQERKRNKRAREITNEVYEINKICLFYFIFLFEFAGEREKVKGNGELSDLGAAVG